MKKVAIIYIPGYKRNNDFAFLRNFMLENKKCNFFSFSYNLERTDSSHFTIKEIILNLKKDIDFLFNNYNFDEYYLIGHSLGAALAIEMVAKKLIKCNRLILISVFDDRKNLLKSKSINLPNNENIKPFNSIRKIKKMPITFIHGMFDKSVDLKRGLKVFNNSNKKSILIVLPTDHYFNDTYSKTFFLKVLSKFL